MNFYEWFYEFSEQENASTIFLVFLIIIFILAVTIYLALRRNPFRAKKMKKLVEEFGLNYERVDKKGVYHSYPFKENIITGNLNGKKILIYDLFEYKIGWQLFSILTGRPGVEKKTTKVIVDRKITKEEGYFRWLSPENIKKILLAIK